MPGRPKRAALVKAINTAGGEDAIIDRITAGETIAAIADSLGASRPMLSTFLNRSPDAKERLTRARETSAHALVEEALAIADSATHDDDRAKRLQIQMRQWLAGKFNRAAYGDAPAAAVQVNLGQLHLDSLRRVNANPPPRPAHLVVSSPLANVKAGDTAQIEPGDEG